MIEAMNVFETTVFDASPLLAADADPVADQGRTAAAKWGSALDGGFQIIPDLILRHQLSLKLTANDLIVLLHLTMAWWEADRPPYPRASTIARRMGTSERTVQRSISSLGKKHLFRKLKVRDGKGEWRQAFDLTPLANRLKEIAATDLITERRRMLKVGAVGVQTQSPAQAQ